MPKTRDTSGSDAWPALVPGAGQDFYLASGAADDKFRFRRSGDAHPRVEIDLSGEIGAVKVGSGASAPLALSGGGSAGGSPLGTYDVTQFGLLDDDATDNTAAYAVMLFTLVAQGVTHADLYFPKKTTGHYRFASGGPSIVHSHWGLSGDGVDVTFIDNYNPTGAGTAFVRFIGTEPTPGSFTGRLSHNHLSDLTINNAGNADSIGLECFAVTHLQVERVAFRSWRRNALKGHNFADSRFNDCEWEYNGSADVVSNHPAIWLGKGSSSEWACDQIWFNNNRFEHNAMLLRAVSSGGFYVNKLRFLGGKVENVLSNGNGLSGNEAYVVLNATNYVLFDGVDFTFANLRGGSPTQSALPAIIKATGTTATMIVNCFVSCEQAVRSFNDYLWFDGSVGNLAPTVVGTSFAVSTNNQPAASHGAVLWTGTNTRAQLVCDYGWIQSGSPALEQGSATSLSARPTGGGGGVTDHGALTGLSDPDHPIAAVVGLQAAIDGKAPTVHVHSGADITTGTVAEARIDSTIARDAEVVLQSLVDAKADLLVGIADNTVARLPVGANNHVLTADSALTAGVKWAAAAGGVTYAGGPLFIAASDAPAAEKATAHVICTGTNDHTAINDAMQALVGETATAGRRGAIELSTGTFQLGGPILIPARGFMLRGQGLLTRIRAASGFNGTAGEGSTSALIKLAATNAGRFACAVRISDLYLDCNVGTTSGIVFDQTNTANGGAEILTGTGSETVYGQPVTQTNGDTWHHFSNMHIYDPQRGVYFIGGSSNNGRGNRVEHVTVHQARLSGFKNDKGSDLILLACSALTDSPEAAAVGFDIDGGNTRLIGCKCAYYRNFDVASSTGSTAFKFSSSRVSAFGCEAQDFYNAFVIGGVNFFGDIRCDTQESSAGTCIAIDADRVHMDAQILLRSGVTVAKGISFSGSGQEDHTIRASIDEGPAATAGPPATPDGDITNRINIGSGAEITNVDNLPRGSYDIRLRGPGGAVVSYLRSAGSNVVSGGHTLKDAGVGLTQRGGMNFLNGFTLADDLANDETEITADFGTGATQVAQGDHLHSSVYQPLDADLTALAGLGTAADKMPYFTGPQAAAVTDVSAYARASILPSADAAALKAGLGLSAVFGVYGGIVGLGHSYSQLGGGGSAGATAEDIWTNYLRVLAAALTIPADETFIWGRSSAQLTSPTAGDTADPQGFGTILRHIVPNSTFVLSQNRPTGSPWPGVFVLLYGYNEVLRNAANSSTGGATAFTHALRTVVSRVRAAMLYDSRSSNVTYSGFSATTAVPYPVSTSGVVNTGAEPDNLSCTGPSWRISAVNGNTVTFTVPADWNGGTVGVTLFAPPGTLCYLLTALPDTTGMTLVLKGSILGDLGYLVLAAGDIIQIDSEKITLGATSDGGITWTGCTRGAAGTTATSHAASAAAKLPTDTASVTWSASTAAGASATAPTPLAGLGASSDGVYIGDVSRSAIPVTTRFTIPATDAGKTIVATVAGIIGKEWVGFDSAVLEDANPPPVLIITQPDMGGTMPGGGSFFHGATATAFNGAMQWIAGEFGSSVKIVDLHTQGASGSFTSLFKATVQTAISSTGTTTLHIIPGTASQCVIDVGSRLRVLGSLATETMLVTAITKTSDILWTLTVTRNYDGLGAQASIPVDKPVMDSRWLSSDWIHPSDLGHKLIAAKCLDALATLTQTTKAIATTGGYVLRRQPRLVNNGLVGSHASYGRGTAAGQAIGKLTAFPIEVSEKIIITQMATEVTAVANAAGLFRFGIWADGGGRPGALLYESGTVTQGVVGERSIAVPHFHLRPGWYWFGVAVQGTGTMATVRTNNGGPINDYPFQRITNGALAIPTGAYSAYSGISVTGATGSLAGVFVGDLDGSMSTLNTENAVMQIWATTLVPIRD